MCCQNLNVTALCVYSVAHVFKAIHNLIFSLLNAPCIIEQAFIIHMLAGSHNNPNQDILKLADAGADVLGSGVDQMKEKKYAYIVACSQTINSSLHANITCYQCAVSGVFRGVYTG